MLYIEDFRSMHVLDDNCVEFIDAAANGDVNGVRRMLDSGMHPDTQGPKGWTALRKAAFRDKYEVAYVLLSRGAHVDATSYTGQTALMMACAYGHDDMVTLLLFHGADPNLTNCSGRTALMIASSDGYSRAVGALLDARPRIDINQTDRRGKTALHMAVEYGHAHAAKMLEAAGAMPVANNRFGSHDLLQPCIPVGGVA